MLFYLQKFYKVFVHKFKNSVQTAEICSNAELIQSMTLSHRVFSFSNRIKISCTKLHSFVYKKTEIKIDVHPCHAWMMDLLHVDVACCLLLLGPLAIEVVCRDGGRVQHLDGAD